MKAFVIDEPEVEFAAGCRHVDPRFGIADYGPVDRERLQHRMRFVWE